MPLGICRMLPFSGQEEAATVKEVCGVQVDRMMEGRKSILGVGLCGGESGKSASGHMQNSPIFQAGSSCSSARVMGGGGKEVERGRRHLQNYL